MKLVLVAALALGGCTTATRVTGLRHAPTDPDSIVELSLPPQQYQEVAQLSVDAYSNESNVADNRLHSLAARVGANAIILGPVSVCIDTDRREVPEKPRVAQMTTYTATAIWVPAGDPALTLRD
jgi:hypothetical protein